MSNQFHLLQVSALAKPIKEATSITFELPPHLVNKFNYYPGQHLIIKFKIDGAELRRTYSLNSCPFKDEDLQVTVKRVKGGIVSNYVGDHLRVGDSLEVMIPQGRFFAEIKEEDYKTYFLFAAGSGITPIISILKSVLLASPYSTINMLYGNSNQDSIIFKKELDQLKSQYPDRLNIVHTLSAPKVWSKWEQWKGRIGRVDQEAVEWFITNHPPIAQNTEYYICGPGTMNSSVRNTLISLGIPEKSVHIEQFGGTVEAPKNEIKAVDNAQLIASIHGRQYELSVPRGKTILQVLKEANAEPPYSCESGVCATCLAKVHKGRAEMKACMALTEQEIQDGLILTCQAVPVTNEISIQY